MTDGVRSTISPGPTRYTYERWRQRPWTEKFMETVVQPIRSQL